MDGQELADNLDKVATIIDEFDRVADLQKHYNIKLLMPADFLYDVDIKAAEAVLEDAVELDRHVFSISKLAELRATDFETVLGQDFKEAIVKKGTEIIDEGKLSDNLSSLPKPDRSALEAYLMAHFG